MHLLAGAVGAPARAPKTSVCATVWCVSAGDPALSSKDYF